MKLNVLMIVYHYIQFKNLTPDLIVDISKQIELKLKAVKAYTTQFYNPNNEESETITAEAFVESKYFLYLGFAKKDIVPCFPFGSSDTPEMIKSD